MIRPQFFYESLANYGINFYAGVPDSLLKNLCAYITDHADSNHNIIAANEGGAMGLAAGHYLATGQIPVVYMQNSGEGNIINPLASLTDPDVYNIQFYWLSAGGVNPVFMMNPNMLSRVRLLQVFSMSWVLIIRF